MFKVAMTGCGPNVAQYAATDPKYKSKFYMDRKAMQSFEISAKYEPKNYKVFGVCTPSVAAAGKYGKDNSATDYGTLSLTGALDCSVAMFGYGIYGGVSVYFVLDIYKDYAQATFGANVYIAAGDKEDPFLTGGITVEMSEWSFGCCWRRQKRLKVDLSFEVDVWFLPTFSYAAVLFNTKFGIIEPRSCSNKVIEGCECE